MKKTLYFLLFLSLLFVCLNTLAFAGNVPVTEDEGVTDTETVADENTNSDVSEITEDNADTNIEDNIHNSESTEDNTAEHDETPATTDDEAGGFFTSLYQAYEENKGDIFSFASALISLVLVFVYQKGLVPVLKGGLTLIEGQVKNLQKANAETKNETEKTSEQTLALAVRMEECGGKMKEVLDELLARASESEAQQKEIATLRESMLYQAELLGEVFLASSLPEYSKERVAKTLERVRDHLTPKDE